MPCRIKLLPVEKGAAAFHDFEEYERLVDVARAIDQRTYLIVLLGGEAGLRCGEMIALEWGDVDLAKRQLCVRRSDWNGQVGTPKGGTAALRAAHTTAHRGARRASAPEEQAGVLPGRSHAVHAADRARPDATGGEAGERQAWGAHPASHVLLAPLDARGAAKGDPGARPACGSDHDPALHAPQSGSPRRGDRAAGAAVRRSKLWRYIGNGGPAAKTINESGGITGGEAGIRTLDRGLSPYNGLANRRLRPLGHLTARLQVYVTTALTRKCSVVNGRRRLSANRRLCR
jgi:hypothetical protein